MFRTFDYLESMVRSAFSGGRFAGCALFACVVVWTGPATVPMDHSEVSFDRDVRPILSEYCFKCHGPDAKARKAKLRLDTREGLFAQRQNGAAVVVGDSAKSELIRRLTTHDLDDRMPPTKTKQQLSEAQIRTVRTWIDQGAKWESHWSFSRPQRPALPKLDSTDWPITSIDHFVLARLQKLGIRPAKAADKRRLLRRVTLDLTGVPPSLSEIAVFVADSSADAYGKVVDRLLASPRYGERMAWDWLDAARYADTNGYQGDLTRTMWPYRDWVIDALNENLSYDDFVTWQLAGDLLPDPTIKQRLATAFSRNHMINGEGGRIAEENRIEYIFDSVETVSTVWMGLTMNCARCHDHKFDPVSQRNYYQLFDYFNQTVVTGAGGNPQTPPVLAVRSEKDTAKLVALESALARSERLLRTHRQKVSVGQSHWESDFARRSDSDPKAWVPLLPVRTQSAQGQDLSVQSDRSILVSGNNPLTDTYSVQVALPVGRITGLRLEALRDASMTGGGLARSNSGNFVLTEIQAKWIAGDQAESKPVGFDSAVATFEQAGFSIGATFDGKSDTGWAVYQGRNIDRSHAAVFRLVKPIENLRASTLIVTLHHDSKHKHHILGRFRLSATSAVTPRLDDKLAKLRKALQTPRGKRTKSAAKLIADSFLESDHEYVRIRRQRDEAKARRDQLLKDSAGVKVMVMEDRPGDRRKTHVLYKGLYNERRGIVTANVPKSLPALPPGAPSNRLGLARWLVAPNHPLTTRVTVNRHWQKFFGTGLVKTVEDFGAQGHKPSHPELLDWLATEFLRTGWDVKALHRLIVRSATYRQTAHATPDIIQRDPENRLLARGPRHRLPSWMIRDLALSVSGLLVEDVGGPPVRPYQPGGIWSEATFGKSRYQADSGSKLYRRSLYTFWRRIIGPTMFFDVSKRQICSVAVLRTNTPLHALVTLNDIAYVEAARVLAERLLVGGGDANSRLTRAFELATSRRPTDPELKILLGRLEILRRDYTANPSEAKKLVAVGASPRDSSIDVVEHAAWTGICSLILNLDEALSN
jgi:hypothetical protein